MTPLLAWSVSIDSTYKNYLIVTVLWATFMISLDTEYHSTTNIKPSLQLNIIKIYILDEYVK